MKKFLMACILLGAILIAACSKPVDELNSIITNYKYDIQNGIVVQTRNENKHQEVDDLTIESHSICLIKNVDGMGWKATDGQNFRIAYTLGDDKNKTNEEFCMGLIYNGEQLSAFNYSGADGICMDCPDDGEYYIYFINTSSEDVKLTSFRLKLQDNDSEEAYIL